MKGLCLTIIVIALIISAVIGSFCWTYSINAWLVFFGKSPVLTWWQGALIGFVPYVGQASIPVAAITWILMLFLV
jgi:hypothetical protein